MATLCNNFEQV